MDLLGKFNRFEVIDHTRTGLGRLPSKWEEFDFYVYTDTQDEERTLKVFLSEKENNGHR